MCSVCAWYINYLLHFNSLRMTTLAKYIPYFIARPQNNPRRTTQNASAVFWHLGLSVAEAVNVNCAV